MNSTSSSSAGSRGFRGRWACMGAALGLLALAGEARATVIIGTTPPVKRTGEMRATAYNPFYVNHKDCVENNDFIFNVSVSGLKSGDTLVPCLSVDSDCKEATERE